MRFGEEEFLDGVTLSNREFYERLIETDEIPKTSQITPFDYSSHFEKAVKAGDQVISYCFGYTGFSDETLQKYIHDSVKLYEGHIDAGDRSRFRIMKVGATIGTYAGPGAIAVAFFSK